jgi:hypothetical protein
MAIGCLFYFPGLKFRHQRELALLGHENSKIKNEAEEKIEVKNQAICGGIETK